MFRKRKGRIIDILIRENFIESRSAKFVPDAQIQFLLIVYIFEPRLGEGINVWTLDKKNNREERTSLRIFEREIDNGESVTLT